jgi:hypothetical protein
VTAVSDTPVYDEVAEALGKDPSWLPPCTCDRTPEECARHPEARFDPAPAWPGDEVPVDPAPEHFVADQAGEDIP